MHSLFRHFLIFTALISIFSACPREGLAQNRIWGTYYGGEGSEWASKIATDSAGNAYVTGKTESKVGVVTPNAFDTSLDGISGAYVAKFDPSGKPVWATYYGDSSQTQGTDIGLDVYGNVYVLGNTSCPSNGLATVGAYDSVCQGAQEMFLVKFDSQGKRLWGTYFGGANAEYSDALSVSPAGDVYLIGNTDSPQGIVPMSSPDSSFGGDRDSVIAKFSSQGKLYWARYYGGIGFERGADIACKTFALGVPEVCYITGQTTSGSGIATPGTHDTVYAVGNSDAYLARIEGNSGALVWGTYYGGNGRDDGLAVVVDSNLNAIIGGFTFSSDSIASGNGFDKAYTGDGRTDLFLAKFTPSGARLVGTYYGGTNQELFYDMAIDANNKIYVLGSVEVDSGLPTAGAYDATFNGQYDVILAKFDSVLVRLRATYYGGSYFEMGGGSSGGVSVSPSNQIYLYGTTGSDNSIATPGAFKTIPQGSESFLVKFSQWP